MLTLETPRLVLRNWREDDVDSYLLLAQDVGYNCFAPPGRFAVRDSDEAKEKIRERIALFEAQRLGKFPVFLKASGEFIGTCGVEPFEYEGRAEVELGYRLCLKHWEKGFASEAARAIVPYVFDSLGRERILAFAVPQNRASLRVLEKIGFRNIGEINHANLPHRLYELRKTAP